MNCKIVPLLFLLLSAIPGRASSECKTGYTTTIIVEDADGAAVANVNVRVKLSCGDQGTQIQKTNSQGEAVFKYALSDIGGTEITFSGFHVESMNPSQCTGDERNKRCVIKFGG